jgi:Uma2 family endonuclease
MEAVMRAEQTKLKSDMESSIHRFTVDEYHRLSETGILHEDDNVELIEGRIINMVPIGSRHASCVKRLVALLVGKLQKRAIVSVQDPVDLNEKSEPETDIAILKWRDDFYKDKHPSPQDILLIIEVADASLEYDKFTKTQLYAKSGIQEVWLINLLENTIEIYRSPSINGYKIITRLSPAETASPLSFPDIVIKAGELLGM